MRKWPAILFLDAYQILFCVQESITIPRLSHTLTISQWTTEQKDKRGAEAAAYYFLLRHKCILPIWQIIPPPTTKPTAFSFHVVPYIFIFSIPFEPIEACTACLWENRWENSQEFTAAWPLTQSQKSDRIPLTLVWSEGITALFSRSSSKIHFISSFGTQDKTFFVSLTCGIFSLDELQGIAPCLAQRKKSCVNWRCKTACKKKLVIIFMVEWASCCCGANKLAHDYINSCYFSLSLLALALDLRYTVRVDLIRSEKCLHRDLNLHRFWENELLKFTTLLWISHNALKLSPLQLELLSKWKSVGFSRLSQVIVMIKSITVEESLGTEVCKALGV